MPVLSLFHITRVIFPSPAPWFSASLVTGTARDLPRILDTANYLGSILCRLTLNKRMNELLTSIISSGHFHIEMSKDLSEPNTETLSVWTLMGLNMSAK